MPGNYKGQLPNFKSMSRAEIVLLAKKYGYTVENLLGHLRIGNSALDYGDKFLKLGNNRLYEIENNERNDINQDWR